MTLFHLILYLPWCDKTNSPQKVTLPSIEDWNNIKSFHAIYNVINQILIINEYPICYVVFL